MEEERFPKYHFSICEKEVDLYPAALPDRPVIYVNTVQEEADRICRMLRESQCPDFTLVAVSGLVWEHDLTPWDIPPISADAAPCTGGAEEYLRLLTEEIVPEAEKRVQGEAPWRGIAGYSLAGLFALYAAYRTGLFSRIASVSGSLWFPGFRDYVFSHEMKAVPERLYLSLGDRESRTGNPVLRTVRERTEALCAFYREKGIRTEFRLNPGNHFKNAVQRTVAGMMWILGEEGRSEKL